VTSHPLDRAIWEALTTCQRDLSEGNEHARRFIPAVAPFAATREDSATCRESLRSLVSPGDRIALTTTADIDAPPGLIVAIRDTIDQMVLEGEAAEPALQTMEPLTAADTPAMLALAGATRPGPFGPRTIEMGSYVGVKSEGKLVAMAGERMRLDGFTEVSAVCVDASHRGQGLAADLVLAVTQGITTRGEVPFLHVFASNTAAIALYRKLGFVLRRKFRLTVLTAAPQHE
jgi:ribosomal protein S18 acetylase RimI-like enzyme